MSPQVLSCVLESVLPIVVLIGGNFRALFQAYFVGLHPGAALLSDLSTLDIVAARTYHRLGGACPLSAMSLAGLPTSYVLFTPIVDTKRRMTTSRAN